MKCGCQQKPNHRLWQEISLRNLTWSRGSPRVLFRPHPPASMCVQLSTSSGGKQWSPPILCNTRLHTPQPSSKQRPIRRGFESITLSQLRRSSFMTGPFHSQRESSKGNRCSKKKKCIRFRPRIINEMLECVDQRSGLLADKSLFVIVGLRDGALGD